MNFEVIIFGTVKKDTLKLKMDMYCGMYTAKIYLKVEHSHIGLSFGVRTITNFIGLFFVVKLCLKTHERLGMEEITPSTHFPNFSRFQNFSNKRVFILHTIKFYKNVF